MLPIFGVSTASKVLGMSRNTGTAEEGDGTAWTAELFEELPAMVSLSKMRRSLKSGCINLVVLEGSVVSALFHAQDALMSRVKVFPPLIALRFPSSH